MFLQSHTCTSCPGIYLKTYLSNTYVIRYSILKYKHILTNSEIIIDKNLTEIMQL